MSQVSIYVQKHHREQSQHLRAKASLWAKSASTCKSITVSKVSSYVQKHHCWQSQQLRAKASLWAKSAAACKHRQR
eukprot:1148663-Pelagomonas_calceolata.AAC.16